MVWVAKPADRPHQSLNLGELWVLRLPFYAVMAGLGKLPKTVARSAFGGGRHGQSQWELEVIGR